MISLWVTSAPTRRSTVVQVERDALEVGGPGDVDDDARRTLRVLEFDQHIGAAGQILSLLRRAR